MELKNISNQELQMRIEKLVRSERKIMHVILQHIIEFEDRRLYALLGYDSMFSYLTCALGYSESGAYRRIQSARLLKKLPEIANKIESGALNLSKLTQVQKCLTQLKKQNKSVTPQLTKEILNKIETTFGMETQKILAVEFNLPIISQTIIKPQKDESVRLELTFTKEQFESLKISKDLLSHICVDGNWADVITTLADKFNRAKLGKIVKEESSNMDDKVNVKNSSSIAISVGRVMNDHHSKIYNNNFDSKNQRSADGNSNLNYDCSLNAKSLILESENLTLSDEGLTHSLSDANTNEFETKKNETSTQILSNLTNFSLELKKDESHLKYALKNNISCKSQNNISPALKTKRRHISVRTQRKIRDQSNQQCEFVSEAGLSCKSTFQLQIDHRTPLALGGSHEPANLRIFCRTHNLLAAKHSGLLSPL